MNNWIDTIYAIIFGAAILLSVIGIWFTAIIPGMDRWSKRFFLSYFTTFLLSCLSGIIEMVILYSDLPNEAMYITLILETVLMTLPIMMITIYLLHCSEEDIRSSRLLRIVTGLWALYMGMLVCVLLIKGFIYIAPNNRYYRGPLYPILLIPPIVILLTNIAATIRRRDKLSRKTYLSFLIALVPMTAAMAVQLFFDVFPLIDISYVLVALSMYSLILSDQIEKDQRHQQEIANQRASIMVLQMRPHYIYNTLMSIYSLCKLDPNKARQVMMDFTNYLRKNFYAVASEKTIPFTAELEHTRAYLAVEQVQYEDMLFVDYDTPFTNFRLPPLTLQPIVENSVKHGIDPYSGPLHISIHTQHTDSGTDIIVEDNGPGFDLSDENKPQTALLNIRQRLGMMCGGTMLITRREGGGTVVKITIP